jgi:hypothetical protein
VSRDMHDKQTIKRNLSRNPHRSSLQTRTCTHAII